MAHLKELCSPWKGLSKVSIYHGNPCMVGAWYDPINNLDLSVCYGEGPQEKALWRSFQILYCQVKAMEGDWYRVVPSHSTLTPVLFPGPSLTFSTAPRKRQSESGSTLEAEHTHTHTEAKHGWWARVGVSHIGPQLGGKHAPDSASLGGTWNPTFLTSCETGWWRCCSGNHTWRTKALGVLEAEPLVEQEAVRAWLRVIIGEIERKCRKKSKRYSKIVTIQDLRTNNPQVKI